MKIDEQHGGNHYLALGPHQPLEVTRQLYGEEGYEAAIMNLVLKYLMRRKGERMSDLLKAIDCIERLVELEQERLERAGKVTDEHAPYAPDPDYKVPQTPEELKAALNGGYDYGTG